MKENTTSKIYLLN